MKNDYSNFRKRWSEQEDKEFTEDWIDDAISINKIIRKYKRPYTALVKRAYKLGIGQRHMHTEYLTVNDICREMQVAKQTVIASWINRFGLKSKKSKTAHKNILVSQEDLLNFLKEHQDLFNASAVSEYLFTDEPKWFKEKRARDAKWYPSRNCKEWDKDEDNKLEHMFKRGYTDEEIGIELHRTVSFIKYRRYELNLHRHNWNEYELQIIRDNSRTKTVQELEAMLPLRTARGIALKAMHMGLEYHWSKDKCKPS